MTLQSFRCTRRKSVLRPEELLHRGTGEAEEQAKPRNCFSHEITGAWRRLIVHAVS